jgi:hypothetical protein
MVQNYVDDDHIRAFLANGKVERLDSQTSFEAKRHLENTVPLRNWSTIIDWNQVPSTVLNWMNTSDDEALVWGRNTIAGQCPLGLLLYASDQPCLVGSLEFMLTHLDELVWKAPGCRILFGVNRDESGRILFGDGLIEFDGKCKLIATVGSKTTVE